jgi:ABC-type phosphate transport system ATPase subunit
MSLFTFEAVEVAKGGKLILGPIDWHVEAGKISTVLGPSGSGKTSLLRLMNRLDDPTSGHVFYSGQPIEGCDVSALRREVAMVFQRTELFEGTVEANLLFGPGLHDMSVDLDQLAGLVRLAPDLMAQSVTTLSGGQAQKVAIARAMSVGPKVLLLDEPTSGLDPTATLQIEQLVRCLVTDLGLTCIFVTHDIEQAKRVADSALLLIDGRKVEGGPIAEVLARPKDPRTLRFIRGELL